MALCFDMSFTQIQLKFLSILGTIQNATFTASQAAMPKMYILACKDGSLAEERHMMG